MQQMQIKYAKAIKILANCCQIY